jgi:AmmeMemoRadiSam system protein B
MATAIRPAAFAGRWYPGSRGELERVVDAHLARGGEPCPGVLGLVSPHAGLMYSGPVAGHSYASVAAQPYDVVVLLGPSHYVGFDGVLLSGHMEWEVPLGVLPVDAAIAQRLLKYETLVRTDVRVHEREHSLELQMPFLVRVLPGVPIVPLLMGYQTRETEDRLGTALAEVLADRRPLLVASSDLSHYQNRATAARMDAIVIKHLEQLDPDGLQLTLLARPDHACGGGPMVSILRAARAVGASAARVLAYADSGDISGDTSEVVGYVSASFGVAARASSGNA